MSWPIFINYKQKYQYTLICIVGAAIAAMGLSLWIGMQQSVWFDEAYSVLVAKQEPAQILQLAAADVHPPAYYLLLHSWGDMWGWDDAPLRLLSVLAFGGSVVVAGLLARRLFGDRAAITSVAIIALSPLLLRYGFEIRMYAIASLIGVAATYVLVIARESVKKSWRLWLLYAALIALGTLTLYHLVLLWAAHVVWLLYLDRRKLKQFWKLPWARSFAGAILLFTPWLPAFLGQLGNGALANIGQPMNVEQLLGVISFNAFYKPLWQVGVLGTVVMIVLMTAGVIAYLHAYKQRQLRDNLLLVTAYIAVPVLLFMGASFLKPLYVERYLSHVAIGLMILVGAVLARAVAPLKPLHQLGVYAVGGVILASGVYHLIVVGNFNFQRMQKPAVAITANAINCTGATVVAADPYVATELAYYLPATCDMRFYSEWEKMGGGYAPFSESPLRLESTKIPRLTDSLYYVYYDEPKLEVAPEYKQINKRTNGGLTVVEYVAR